MRPIKEITPEEENFRIEVSSISPNIEVIRRDAVKPEIEGKIVLMAFRVTGYDRDCDGSLMARLEHIDKDGEATGWEPRNLGLYPDIGLVVTQEEWGGMFKSHDPK